jgi:hypothetical protein
MTNELAAVSAEWQIDGSARCRQPAWQRRTTPSCRTAVAAWQSAELLINDVTCCSECDVAMIEACWSSAAKQEWPVLWLRRSHASNDHMKRFFRSLQCDSGSRPSC